MTTDPRPAHQLTGAQARAAVVDALTRIVPDADLDSVGDQAPFRTELELDSLDFLSFVESVSAATGVRVDEMDYPRLTTIDGCVAFLTGR